MGLHCDFEGLGEVECLDCIDYPDLVGVTLGVELPLLRSCPACAQVRRSVAVEC